VRFLDRWLGRGGASVTVPVMDGPFLPNRKLETADVAAELAEADNLTAHHGALYASSGADLVRLGAAGFETVETFAAPISALASRGEALAVALDGEGVEIRGGALDRAAFAPQGEALRCVTALAWLNDWELVVCNGSGAERPRNWRRSLMQLDASGFVLKLDLKSREITRIAGGLAWPAGIAVAGDQIFVAESWRHRIVAIPVAGGAAKPALEGLPAYPVRLSAAASGGFWLSFYSVRNQLVEFILQEPAYRRRMIAEIPEPLWMAPSLSSGRSFKEPMQGSQLKQMGILKPYSAARSYGLVAYCDAQMTPLGSFHSRADGRRHGAVSACEWHGDLLVASRGSGTVLRIGDPMTALTE
jgi:hypothetical protein